MNRRIGENELHRIPAAIWAMFRQWDKENLMLRSLRQIGQFVSVVVSCIGAVILIGCEAPTVTPLVRAGDTLTKPDRVLIYDFAVTPGEVDLDRGLGPQVLRSAASEAQTDEEIQVGKAVARALTDSLVRELRGRGINAYRATETSPPGEDTASIKGRFLRIDQKDRSMRTLVGFGLGGGQVRTHIWIFQGTGLSLRLVAEGETSTQSNLKPGIVPVPAAIEADAGRTAKEVADRIADYCKRRGWVD